MLRTCVARSLALGPALLAIPERTRLAPVGAEALHAQVVIATGGVILHAVLEASLAGRLRSDLALCRDDCSADKAGEDCSEAHC